MSYVDDAAANSQGVGGGKYEVYFKDKLRGVSNGNFWIDVNLRPLFCSHHNEIGSLTAGNAGQFYVSSKEIRHIRKTTSMFSPVRQVAVPGRSLPYPTAYCFSNMKLHCCISRCQKFEGR